MRVLHRDTHAQASCIQRTSLGGGGMATAHADGKAHQSHSEAVARTPSNCRALIHATQKNDRKGNGLGIPVVAGG